MASYIMNPSRKISEILAQFLEFDSKQLHFGIWSGDLTISNVKLKEDAFSAFLNSSNVTPENNKEPLQLKLVRGKVGHIRLKIPWKSLVWGQEPVRLFISDIDIVFSYESRDEARRRSSRRKSCVQHNDISNEGHGRKDGGLEIDDELLEQKYLWLEEAEKRLLRGLPLQEPISASAASLHQKNVQRDSGSKGFFASLVDQMKTSLGMNAAAGLQAEIRNVRITIQQGDIEIGCMLRGLELNSPSEREGSTNTETSNLSSSELNKSTTGHPSNNRSEKNKQIQRESEPDFWKIDKELLIIEFTIFLRKFDPLVSPVLHSFVKPSDLILTPTKIVIPITYISPRPFHKENSKKMCPHHHIDMSSQAETSFTYTDATKMEGKSRRGKREKINDIPLNDLHKTSEAAFCNSPGQDKRKSSVENLNDNTRKSNSSLPERADPCISIHDSCNHQCAHFEMKVGLSELTCIFTRQHFINSMLFFSSLTRMERGSPRKKIKDFLHKKSLVSKVSPFVQGTFTEVHNKEGHVQDAPPNFDIEKEYIAQVNEDYLNHYRKPLLRVSLTRYTSHPTHSKRLAEKLIQFPFFLSERELVVRSWWRYAYNCVLSELRRRKMVYSKCVRLHDRFDWKKQRHKRGEYIDLYLRCYIESSNSSGEKNVLGRLRHIEAELAVEQILLYRSIARKLHVRGIQLTGDSILCLHKETSYQALFNKRLLKSMNGKNDLPRNKISSSIYNRRLVEEDALLIRNLRDKANDARSRRNLVSRGKTKETSAPETENSFSGCCNIPTFSSKKSSKFDHVPLKLVPDSSTSNSQGLNKELKPNEVGRNQQHILSKSSGVTIALEVKIDLFQFMIVDIEACDISSRDLKAQGGVSGNESLEVCDGLSEVMSRLTDDDTVSEIDVVQHDVEGEYEPFLFINIPASYSSKHRILDARVNAIKFSHHGRTESSKTSFLKFDNISILGSDECCLVTTDINQLARSSCMNVSNVDNVEFGKNGHNSALKILFSFAENKKKNLFIELSKIHLSVELRAINAIFNFFQLDILYFPKRLLTETDKDKALDYFVNQLEESQSLHLMKDINIALQCNGIDLLMHSDEAMLFPEKEKGSDGQALTECSFQTLRFSASSFHFFAGEFLRNKSRFDNELNYHYSSREQPGMRFKQYFSFTPIQTILVDPEDWHSQQQNEKMVRTGAFWERIRFELTSHQTKHLIIIRGINLSTIVTKSSSERDSCSELPFLQQNFDIQAFIIEKRSSCGIPNGFSFSLSMSPFICLFSKRRVFSLHSFLELTRKFPRWTQESSMPSLSSSRFPRLEQFSQHKIYSVQINMKAVKLLLISDDKEIIASTLDEHEILVEEALSDFLSFVACFDAYDADSHGMQLSRKICVERLIGVGFNPETAVMCAETACRQFFQDIDMIKEAQTRTWKEHSKSKDFVTGTEDNSDSFIKSNPNLVEVESVLDENSEESLDIIETALQNAVEQTLSSFLYLLKWQPRCGNTVVEIVMNSGIHLTAVSLFYDSHFCLKFESLSCRNCAGIEFFSVHGNFKEPQQEIENCSNGFIHELSLFQVDKYYDFAEGGFPISILNQKCHDSTRNQEIFIDTFLDNTQLTFCSTVIIDVIDIVEELILLSKSYHRNSEDYHAPSTVDLSFQRLASTFVAINDVSLCLLSEDMKPFSELKLQKVECVSHTEITMNAMSLTLLNLTPEGQYFPKVIHSVYLSEAADVVPVLRFKFIPSALPWNTCSVLTATLNGVEIILLYQFILEIMQFLRSDSYGIGLTIARFHSAPILDDYGNPPPPIHFKINISNSFIILPRESFSTDMICIKLDLFEVFNSYHHHSFKIADENGPLEKGDAIFFGENSREEQGTYEDAVEFFDCRESLGGMNAFSTFDIKFLHRLNILFHNITILSSLHENANTAISSGELKYLQEICFNGRVQHSDRALRASNLQSFAKQSHCQESQWNPLTKGAMSLEILVDSTPKPRILITDDFKGGGKAQSPNFDLSMSQLYLLFSIWYSNMQELPVMFPFKKEDLKRIATDLEIPNDFPSYGSKDFVDRLLTAPSSNSFDVTIHFASLSIDCTFDPPGYYSVVPNSLSYFPEGFFGNAFRLSFEQLVIHISLEEIAITRIGCSARGFQMIDHRRLPPFAISFDTKTYNSPIPWVWVNDSFGLNLDGRDLIHGSLAMPFQTTIFLTPGWTLINLGMESLAATISDLSLIWIVLDFFSAYFSHEAYGNPYFEAFKEKEKFKKKLYTSKKLEISDIQHSHGLNIDFRLWLFRPSLKIPGNITDLDCPLLLLNSDKGLWYHFKSIGKYSSQELFARDLCVQFCNHATDYGAEKLHNSKAYATQLIHGLSFAFRIDYNALTKHTDFVFTFSMESLAQKSSEMCKIYSGELEIQPVTIPTPVICKLTASIERKTAVSPCDVILVVQVFPQVLWIFSNFLGLESGSKDKVIILDNCDSATRPSFNIQAHLSELRFIIIDPTLGAHLPFATLMLSEVYLSSSKFDAISTFDGMSLHNSKSDLHLNLDACLWADYFKLGITRSWEPLIEPFRCHCLYEESNARGRGLTLISQNHFHVNLTNAFLVTLDDAINSLLSTIGKSWISVGTPSAISKSAELKEQSSFMQQINVPTQQIQVEHRIPGKTSSLERIAFSLQNHTGQRIRIHQQYTDSESESECVSRVTYLQPSESSSLDFKATVSIICNLHVVEVPFPGLPNGTREAGYVVSKEHTVDIQIPGFKWLTGVSVDDLGRKFHKIVSRSQIIQSKVLKDWRLENTMNVLSEVGLENGGRLIAIRSLFEIRNHTTHSIALYLHPDPKHVPQSSVSMVNAVLSSPLPGDISYLSPGGTGQVPILLLDAALREQGNHLGSFWVRPEGNEEFKKCLQSMSIFDERTIKLLMTSFSSRPVQLAKVVYESATLFQRGMGEDLSPDKITTGIQISCPIVSEDDGVLIAPFCYIIEIRRSPLIKGQAKDKKRSERKVSFVRGTVHKLGPQAQNRETKREKKNKYSQHVHSPVAYTLTLHPPIVIQNLLSVQGRFEIMHATRRTILWFSDLKPGEKSTIHTVSLDAPLILLVDLGYCRTPVGEGALIHHGTEIKSPSSQGGLRSIGKAVTIGRKQLEKTLTSITDSPDKRGKGKVHLLQNPKFQRHNYHSNQREGSSVNFGLDSGRVHVVSGRSFEASDIATETVVVDNSGQKLTLRIENIVGGGGQRHISLYCPFWIVNTTTHALRYKQEKSSSFVAGSFNLSNNKGLATQSWHKLKWARSSNNAFADTESLNLCNINGRKLASGLPGALSYVSDNPAVSREQTARLLEKDLELIDLYSNAFMFNFHDDTILLSQQRLIVQLYDGTGDSPYLSDWSSGFSLDTIGVPQVLGMHCSEGRVLELSVTIHVAPGNLTGYTKVVRISPSYVLVNRLHRPIRIWQDSSLLHPAFENQSNQEVIIRKNQQRWYFEQALDVQNPYEVLFGGPAGLQNSPPGTTAHKLALFAVAARAGELSPFHLPDTRGDRQFRIDIGGEWNLSPSFNSDVTGEYNFRIRKALNLRDLKHVNTRASPYYQVILPPADGSDWDGELGVWFETVWGGGRKILVKGTKRTRFAFKNTDIRVGDELLQVDDISVAKLTFSETMKLLRERIEQVSNSNKYDYTSTHRPAPQLRSWKKRRSSRLESFGCRSNDDGKEAPDSVVITFRTLEERLRRVRVNASKSNQAKTKGYSTADSCKTISHAELPYVEDPDLIQSVNIQVEVRAIYGSLFVLISEQDSLNPPYKIENRAINHFILYRQRGCVCHPWNILYPGESSDYFWEEPIKAHKLIVRVGSIFFPFQRKGENFETNSIHNNEIQKQKTELNRWLHNQSFHAIDSEDQAGFGAATIVKLEEIGFECELPLPRVNSQQNSLDNSLHCRVDSNGATRVLLISNNIDNQDDSFLMEHNITTLQKGICMAENLVRSYDDLLRPLSKIGGIIDDATTPMSDGVIEKLSSLESQAMELADFPETHTIFQRHQILIEVLEAAGLTISDVTSQCNPYCEIISKGPKKSKSLFANTTISTRKTYFIEGTLSPKWIDQIFVFDLPTFAIQNTREYTIKVRLRSFRFVGQHPYLGETNVHLRSLRDQKELIGWYPLVGRTGRRDLDDTNANWGRGSIKLRVQWIFTVPALIQYFRTIAEENLRKLQESLDGMTSQIRRERSFEPEPDRLNHHDFMKDARIEKFNIATRLFAQRNQRNRSERILPWQLFESMKSSREKILWLFDFQTKSSREARTTLNGLSEGISRCFPPLATKNDIPDLPDIKKKEWNDKKSRKGKLNEIKFLLPSDDDSNLALLHSQHVISPSDIDPIQSKDIMLRKRSFSFEEILRTIDELDRSHIATFSRGSGDLDLDCSELGILEQRKFIDINNVTSLDGITGRRLIYQLKRSKFIREHLFYHVRLAFLEDGFDAIVLPKSRHRLSSAGACFKTMSITRSVMNDPYVEFDFNANKFECFSKLNKCVSRRTVEGAVDNALSQEEVRKKYIMNEIGLPSNAPGMMITRLEERMNSIFIARSAFEKTCKNSLESLLHPGGFLVLRPITALNLPSSYTAISVKVRFGSLTLYTSAVDSRVAPSWVQGFSHGMHHSCVEEIGTSSMAENMNENLKQYSELENDLCIPIDPHKTSGIIRLSVIGERLNSKVELGILEVPIGLAIRCCIESADSKDAASTGLAYCRWFPLMNPKEDNTQKFYGLQTLRSEQEVETWFTQNFLPCIQLVLMWHPQEANNGPSNAQQRQGHLQENQSMPLMRNFKFYFSTLLSRISVSLINSQIGEELISLSFCEIEARCLISMMSTRVTIVIGWIQMDNQLENARERVVLAPTPVGQPEPTLQFLLNKDNIRSKDNVESFELVAFYMEELDFTMEESLILNFWEFIVWMLRKRELKRHALNYQRKKVPNDSNETSQALLPSSNEVSSHQSLLQLLWDENDKPEAKTYIERMYLGPIRVNFTYLKGKRMSAPDMDNPSFLKGSIDGIQDVLSAFHSGPQGFAKNSDIFSKWTDFTHDEDLLTEMGEVKNLPGLIAAILPSVSEAPIRLPGKGITFIFENRSEIFNSLSNYYINEILKQFYKIIGSIDFVGNPTMLLNSFATGVRDFFVAPSKEFFRSPKNPSRLGLGVAKGTLSLVSHSASGLFGFAAKMSATAAQTAAIFSFDHEYQEWHREHILAEAKNLDRHWKRRGAGGISRIFTRPIVDLVRGTILGTAGLITKPINSARKDGPTGILSGFALGTAGVVIKPFVGILDAFSHFAGSIHDVAKSVNVLDKRYRPAKRLRLPHVFSIRHILIPYDAVASQSLQLLKRFPFDKKDLLHQELDGQRLNEVHIASAVLCTDPGIETYVIVSNVRVALVKIKSLVPYHRNEILCWEIPLMGVSNLTSQISEIGHDGIALTISVNYNNKNLHQVTGYQFPFPKMRNLQELESSQKFPGKSRLDGSPRIPGNEQFDNLNYVPDAKKGKENINFFPSGYDDAMHNNDDNSSNDSTDVFSVIADFHHRQKLMRIHNAICCLSQKLDEVVFDQGPITDLGTNGCTSFGELHFTEQKSVNRDSWCDGVEALENVPWVPCFFFDIIRDNDRLKVEEDFHHLRLRWNLGEELNASKLLGGPEWLVKARAEAEYLPECSLLYEEHETEEDKMLQGHEHFTSLYHQDSNCHGTTVKNMDNPVFAHSEKKVSLDVDANFCMHSDNSMPFPSNFIKTRKASTNESGKDVFSPPVKESQCEEGELLLPSIIQHVATQSTDDNSETMFHESPKDAYQRLEKLEKMLETIVEITFISVNNKIVRHSNLDVEVAKLREEVQVLQAALVNQRRQDDEKIERLMKVIEGIQNGVNSDNTFGDSRRELESNTQPKKYVTEISKKKKSEFAFAYKSKVRDQHINLPSKKVIRPRLLSRLRKKEPLNESLEVPSSYVEEVYDDSAEESLEDRPDVLLDDDTSCE